MAVCAGEAAFAGAQVLEVSIMAIDLKSLPKQVRDIIELREDHDMTFQRFVDDDYTEIWWNLLAERSAEDNEHSMIGSIYGTQGSGKSYAAIAFCCFMDPTFNADHIYFNYDDLVNDRHNLKPNTAVLVDEQSQSFGLDSHRIMIVLANLKEQLRKKSIHFFFCSPVLYEEAKSSMYQIEVMFIDYENQESYAALKTREGMTLGHIRVPHPLKRLEDGSTLATQELLDEYERKKDVHLEKVLGRQDMDTFDHRAKMVMQNKMFLKAEKIYKRKFGYIPQATVVQIINKIFPEYHAGVVPLEIAGRIKLEKELSGDWEVSGRVSKKDRGTSSPRKRGRPRKRG